MAAKKKDGPQSTCLVCGKKLKRMTAKHAQTHGMTVEEYRARYEDDTPPVPTNGNQVQVNRGELFDDLAAWIAQDSQLTPIAKRVVDSLLLDDGRRFQVVLRAIASAKMNRMKDMLVALDRVEERLYDGETIAEMTTNQLFQMKKMIADDMSGFTDLLIQITDKASKPGQVSLTQIIDQRTQVLQTDDFPVPSTPQEREQLVRAYDQLKAMAANGQVVVEAAV